MRKYSIEEIEEIISIIKNMKYLPHCAKKVKSNHFGFKTKRQNWIKKIEDLGYIPAWLNQELLKTCESHKVIVPEILDSYSNSTYDLNESYYNLLCDYVETDTPIEEVHLAAQYLIDWYKKYA